MCRMKREDRGFHSVCGREDRMGRRGRRGLEGCGKSHFHHPRSAGKACLSLFSAAVTEYHRLSKLYTTEVY
jgi:hypothetical protein